MKVKAYGKVNLALNIVGVDGGMHIIDTIMASISLFDVVKAVESKCINVECDQKIDGINIAYKASKLLVEYGYPPLDISIKKGIPMASGLGGSSASAAGVLYIASKLFDIKDKSLLSQMALKLGADVAYMMQGGICRCKGYGEQTEKLNINPSFGLTLALGGEVSTKDCYKLADIMPNVSCDIDSVISDLAIGKLTGSNALTLPAKKLQKNIQEIECIIESLGMHAILTGSGGGVFTSQNEKVSQMLRASGFVTHDITFTKQGIEIIND